MSLRSSQLSECPFFITEGRERHEPPVISQEETPSHDSLTSKSSDPILLYRLEHPFNSTLLLPSSPFGKCQRLNHSCYYPRSPSRYLSPVTFPFLLLVLPSSFTYLSFYFSFFSVITVIPLPVAHPHYHPSHYSLIRHSLAHLIIKPFRYQAFVTHLVPIPKLK